MAVKARFTEYVQYLDTPEQVAEIDAIAEAEEKSRSAVVREMVTAGLELRKMRYSIPQRFIAGVEAPPPYAGAPGPTGRPLPADG